MSEHSTESDAARCVCGTLTDLGGPGIQHDNWCPLYRPIPPGSSDR